MARPKEFDRAEVLNRAMGVFWEKGYESASLQDLVERMGIGRASLYDTFGSKRALFGEALDAYSAVMDAEYFSRIHQEGPVATVIRGFFDHTLDIVMSGEKHGCLMLKAALATCRDDPELRERVKDHVLRVDGHFHDRLRKAREQGELAEDADLVALSRALTNGLQGLWVRATLTKDRDCLRDIVEGIMAGLEPHLDPAAA